MAKCQSDAENERSRDGVRPYSSPQGNRLTEASKRRMAAWLERLWRLLKSILDLAPPPLSPVYYRLLRPSFLGTRKSWRGYG